MLNAIIFDFDGVILDSEGLHYKVFNQVLEKYKIYIIVRKKIYKKSFKKKNIKLIN